MRRIKFLPFTALMLSRRPGQVRPDTSALPISQRSCGLSSALARGRNDNLSAECRSRVAEREQLRGPGKQVGWQRMKRPELVELRRTGA
jgi:hypothetical protein